MSFLSGWGRRKSKIINGSTAGAQTNFQMQLTVYKSAGVDTNTQVYLSTNVRDDFGDVRFTDTDGTTLLDYWIESITSGVSAVIWIEIPSIPASPNTTNIYIYYDNASQTTTSSGANTFIQWHGLETANYLDSLIVPTTNIIWEMKIRPTAVAHNMYVGISNTAGFTAGDAIFMLSYNVTNVRNAYTRNNGAESYISSSPSFTNGVDYRLKFERFSSIVHYYINGIELLTGITTNLPDALMGLAFQINTGTFSISFAFVRKYASPEPTFGATESSAVVNVSSTTADGTYTTGQIIDVTIQFEDSVTITGIPQLLLETGATDRQASYSSGSGGTTITLNYTVLAGDTSSDLDYVATNSLTLNSGTIVDINSNNATLTLPTPGAAGSLSANKNIVISAPAITTTPVLGKLYPVVQRGMTFAAGIGASLGRRKTKSR